MIKPNDEVVLRCLRQIDAKLTAFGRQLDEVKAMVRSLEDAVADVHSQVAGLSRRREKLELRVDRVERRLDNIERSLGVVEPAAWASPLNAAFSTTCTTTAARRSEGAGAQHGSTVRRAARSCRQAARRLTVSPHPCPRTPAGEPPHA